MAWEKVPDCEPIAIEVPVKKFELIRRVTAENVATDNYILCDLGYVTKDDNIAKFSEEILDRETFTGMLKLTGMRICKKGVVERWSSYKSGSYDAEHEEAYKREGYEVKVCTKIKTTRIGIQ